jgi:segregation and condensation protein B
MKKRKGKERPAAAEPTASPDAAAADVDATGAEGAAVEATADAGNFDDGQAVTAVTLQDEAPAISEDLLGALPEAVGDDDVTNRVRVSDAQDSAAPITDGEAAVDATAEETVASEDTATDIEGAAVEAVAADGATPADADGLSAVEGPRLESILESLLFAADRPLVVNELKRLLGERDPKRLTAALEALKIRHAESGIQLVSVAGGWQFRTHPGNGAWVAKLVAGRPTRLSRAMMETLSIVAYRQPITRPEIDEIRGVDCGPVLHTLLDRGLIRVIGKKEEVGRPMLYGTTPEFLKIFSLRDLADLPTLREFHELGTDDRAKVDATTANLAAAGDGAGAPGPLPDLVATTDLPDVDPEEEDALIEALEEATNAAGRASLSMTNPNAEAEGDAASASTSSESGES